MKQYKSVEEDIAHIRSMMAESSRFLSLSGLSGIFAGIYALVGATIAYKWIYIDYENGIDENIKIRFILLASSVLLAALSTGFFFTYRNAKIRNQRIWNPSTLKFLVSLFLPLVVGGLLILEFMYWNLGQFIAPLTLIFYGLGLWGASKYTHLETRYLALCQISLGLLSAYFVGYGLLFWALGFGILHIIYGLVMYLKYEK
ncbi:hypothetical protein [Sediminitomix flava]|uniref:Uncharacterized protein n=1 Tax=Sediminitomix flava TaxID=379075 RepID=A0A315Z815_SEDFL|nr:hypothetical protein [Sediminitomix flava]PWJ40191.1 hypothetical protein BC781_105259 [Sediminitomix flava]